MAPGAPDRPMDAAQGFLSLASGSVTPGHLIPALSAAWGPAWSACVWGRGGSVESAERADSGGHAGCRHSFRWLALTLDHIFTTLSDIWEITFSCFPIKRSPQLVISFLWICQTGLFLLRGIDNEFVT